MAEFCASRTQISFVIFANFHPNFAKISSKIHLKRLSQVATDRQKFLENRNKFSARQIRARASVVAAHRADIDRLRKSPRRSQRRPPIAAQGYETSSELSQMREDDANFAQALALAEDLFRPSARDRVALRRARESDLGYGDVTLIGIPTNGALLPYNLAYHILPENFFDDVSTEPSDSEARAEELEQQEELAALSGSGSDSPFGSVHDLEIDDEDF